MGGDDTEAEFQHLLADGGHVLFIRITHADEGIAAFGESMVIIIGGIDLSVGAVMAMAGLVSALCLQAGLPIPLAIIAGLLTERSRGPSRDRGAGAGRRVLRADGSRQIR